ncbi:MAG: 4Fe-4S binding protein [Eubacteriales bacterium]|nr:4Fe-4S binding protein [Eubacteriales bacterium]MDD3200121.1 4Fe-4S binding protein [Eubacteriales bacterium]MDD4122128.1 4Fe-4S binding protein [Eubacteriales bacterium]MDD4630368.1 4Fe-4S binding protein [Eubacteriales bacterium]
MIRTIINIDKEKCNGCELCVSACHEGAIAIVDGKAELIRDDYCDGLGNCLPACPTGAITFIEREAAAFDEAAVEENMKKKQAATHQHMHMHQHNQPDLACGCPGSQSRAFSRGNAVNKVRSSAPVQPASIESQLQQWPVQIQLIPVNAPYFDGANLLIAADCAAYAYANFHNEFIKNRITIIGCPKLDDVDYSEKLTAILANNDIKSVTVVRMEVPCCGGIQNAAITALKNSGKMIPWQVVTISTDGRILE